MSVATTAAEFVRNFARWRDSAMQEPVLISHHGRTSHVLLSEALFSRMNETVAPPSEGDGAQALAEWIDEGVILCDAQGRIIFANRVAGALSGTSNAGLQGKVLFDALPSVVGTVFASHVRRTLGTGEPASADIPSPFFPHSWLHLQSFRMGRQVVVTFRDITSEVRNHRMADTKGAILEAMAVHGQIDYVRLSVRGTVDRVSEGLSRLIGVPESRLAGIALASLVALADRVRFRDALEAVLRDSERLCLDCAFLANDGASVTMRVAMVRLEGAYGCEGAIVLLSHLPAQA